MSDRVGQHLGNYRLTKLLDKGGFAEVYLGEQVYLNTQAAIKVLHARLASEASESFLAEARHLSHLVHPHIIRVLDFGVEDSTPFLVMDYAPHGNLRQRHPRGSPVPLTTIVPYVSQVAAALQHAHDQKLIHRDVKPENMLLGANLEVLLSDFGIALLTHSSGSLHVPEMVGTMAYMAPEQVRGTPTPASDQYALGIVVYEWLCGERPFAGSVAELFSQHLFGRPPPLHDKIPAISPTVEGVVLRALEKDPHLRFEDVRAFATALDEASNTASTSHTLFAPLADPPAAQPVAAPKEPPVSERASPFLNTPPVNLTPLVGREQDVEAGCMFLLRSDIRLLTMTGPGGVGKTRLALAVATTLQQAFADGICFVALAPVSDPDLVVPTVAQALGLKEARNRSLFESIIAFLQEKSLLLVLDNFEQIVAGAPSLAGLLSACPQVKMLITSRAQLRVQGEHEFPVPPLALPDPKHFSDVERLSHCAAVTLFVQRAQSLKPDFELNGENAPPVAAICTQLDGLPLAIELAAARIKLLPPQALLVRLTNRLQVLTGGRQDAPARQQTLRNTIAWSYDLLLAREQALFRRLSVFAGGCTLEAAEAVCSTPSDIASSFLDGVASLLDKSLLLQIEHQSDEPRLLLLETIREFGGERLAASGELEITRDAHATYYLRLAEEAEPQLIGAEQERWWKRLDREQENVRAALQYLLEQWDEKRGGQRLEQALRLGGALEWYWYVRGHLSEGRKWLERALAGSEGVAAPVRAKAFGSAGWLAVRQGHYVQAEMLGEKSLAGYRALADAAGIANALNLVGRSVEERGDYAAASPRYQEALAIARQKGDRQGIAYSLYGWAKVFMYEGKDEQARVLAQEMLSLVKEIGDPIYRSYTYSLLGHLALRLGDDATAQTWFEQSLTINRERDRIRGVAFVQKFLGRLALHRGDHTIAQTLLEESLSIYRTAGDRQGMAESLAYLASNAMLRGDIQVARSLAEEGLTRALELDHKLTIAVCLERLAGVLLAQGEATWAVRLWGGAAALREAIGAPLPPVERAGYEQAVTAARSLLGEQAFAAAWAEGRAMGPEQALATREPQAIPGETPPVTPPRTPASPAPSYPAGLSAREVEVLRLVAQGLTNAQIADQLIISPYTVNAHMRSIYSKLEVNSRIAVMQFASQHHLM